MFILWRYGGNRTALIFLVFLVVLFGDRFVVGLTIRDIMSTSPSALKWIKKEARRMIGQSKVKQITLHIYIRLLHLYGEE